MSDVTITVRVAEDGTYWATAAEYPGVFATGDDLAELRECLQEGISLYLSDDDPAVPAVEVTLAPITLQDPPQATAVAQLAFA